MAFSGWPEEALEFFDGLAAENTKAYWTAHKPVYEEVRAAGRWPSWSRTWRAEFGQRGRSSRPYRDHALDKDKSPYQTHIASSRGRRLHPALRGRPGTPGAGMYGHGGRASWSAYRRAVAGDHPRPGTWSG